MWRSYAPHCEERGVVSTSTLGVGRPSLAVCGWRRCYTRGRIAFAVIRDGHVLLSNFGQKVRGRHRCLLVGRILVVRRKVSLSRAYLNFYVTQYKPFIVLKGEFVTDIQRVGHTQATLC